MFAAYWLVAMMVATCCGGVSAQTSTSGDLSVYVDDIIDDLPGADDNDYTDPISSEIAVWESALEELFDSCYQVADSLMDLVGYDVILYLDTTSGTTHLIIEKQPGSNHYWGTYIFNPAACRSELILMAPHPKKDLNTGRQGVYCYIRCDAFAFMLAGTNRCNAPDASSCSGSTSVCGGGNSPYRISDLAHSTTSIWQHSVAFVKEAVPETYFVQLHGFAMQEDDPYVIMSNGTRETPYPDKIAELRDRLAVVDPVLTFKVGHEDLDWSRLLGFTNTNGRLINESPDPCSQNAGTTTGRWLHIEQEKSRLRQDVSGWNNMARALAATFRGAGCPSVTPVNDHTRWHVMPATAGDGISWNNPNGDLRAVIDLADAGDTIMACEGSYLISQYDDRFASLEIQRSLTILGGFPAGGGLISERNWTTYPTIISGDIGMTGDTSDNSYGLVNLKGLNDTLHIDGWYLMHSASVSNPAFTLEGALPGAVVSLSNMHFDEMDNPVFLYSLREVSMTNVEMHGNPLQILVRNDGEMTLDQVIFHVPEDGTCIVNEDGGQLIEKGDVHCLKQ